MKSLKTYIFESGSSFKSKVNISVKQFNDWKRKNEDKYEIVYSEEDKLYTIYFIKDKANPQCKGEHIGTYNCTSGELFYDDKQIFNELMN